MSLYNFVSAIAHRRLFKSSTELFRLPPKGAVVDWEECVYNLDKLRKVRHVDGPSSTGDDRQVAKDRQTNMPKSWARDLSRSYTQLRTDYETRRSHLERVHGVDYVEEEEDEWDDDDDDGEGIPFLHSNAQHAREEYRPDEDPKFLLFRHLLREYFAGGRAEPSGEKVGKWPFERRQWSPNEEGYYEKGKIKQVPVMRFPSQIEGACGPSVLDLVRREFRAPTVEERLLGEKQGGGDDETAEKVKYPPSSYMDNDVRVQTAFYTLMELNRKLTWAEIVGLTASTIQSTGRDREKRRLVQSARGVSLFSRETKNDEPPNSNEHMNESDSEEDQEFLEALKEISSSPLKCGTYLIAHPLMRGYFAQSVILILDHSDGNVGPSGDKGAGGTYGLIINRLSERQVSDSPQLKQEDESAAVQEITISLDGSSSFPIKLPEEDAKAGSFTLTQAIHADDLPDAVTQAFGDIPVREGGPVGLSLQMVHRKTRQRIDTEDESKQNNGEGASGQIGGTMVPYLAEDSSHHDPTDSDEEIYFGGDVLKASYAVLNGKKKSSDFSFVIGASCWAPGQLEHELERGCWIPFRGPADMAMAGRCDHGTVGDEVPQPIDDLWLSIMAALGAGESDLGHILHNKMNAGHQLGDACDNFDR